jgi:hypothetical protein
MTLDVIPTGKTTATVIFTQDQVDRLRGSQGRGRVPVLITYRGEQYRTSISVYRGAWMMVVNAAMRDGGLVPGASYKVEISHDTATRTVDVPQDLAAALRKAKLTAAFDALSYTNRREHVRAVEEAKRPETRARRIDAVVAKLRDGNTR